MNARLALRQRVDLFNGLTKLACLSSRAILKEKFLQYGSSPEEGMSAVKNFTFFSLPAFPFNANFSTICYLLFL